MYVCMCRKLVIKRREEQRNGEKMIAIIMKRFICEHFPKHYFHRFVVFLCVAHCTWGRRVYDANKHHDGSVIYVRPNKGLRISSQPMRVHIII